MKGILQTWRGFRRLSRDEQLVVAEAAAAIVATWIGLRFFGFRYWKALLERFMPSAPATAAVRTVGVIGRLHRSAARHLFFHANCLEQSLALWWLLRRRGIGAELRVGARKNDGRFEAHAWVELNGAILNDTSEGNVAFAPFDAPVIPAETRTP